MTRSRPPPFIRRSIGCTRRDLFPHGALSPAALYSYIPLRVSMAALAEQMGDLSVAAAAAAAGGGGGGGDAEAPWDTPAWWTKWQGAQPELTLDDKIALAKEVAAGGEIISGEKELRALFERKQNPVAGRGAVPAAAAAAAGPLAAGDGRSAHRGDGFGSGTSIATVGAHSVCPKFKSTIFLARIF